MVQLTTIVTALLMAAPGAAPTTQPATPKVAVTPAKLLLDGKARAAFADAFLPAQVLVHFLPPLARNESPSRRARHNVRGFLLDAGGTAVAVAPTAYVHGASDIVVETHDGAMIPVRALPPAGPVSDTPLLKLVPRKGDSKGFGSRTGLRWADPKSVVYGLKVWGVELSTVRLPGGKRARILLDAEVGKTVEYPLERFRYIGLGRVDGQALLTAEGKIACVVFRTVPGTRNVGLCAPRGAALKVPPPKNDHIKTEKVELKRR